jgi:hypothetical protein
MHRTQKRYLRLSVLNSVNAIYGSLSMQSTLQKKKKTQRGEGDRKEAGAHLIDPAVVNRDVRDRAFGTDCHDVLHVQCRLRVHRALAGLAATGITVEERRNKAKYIYRADCFSCCSNTYDLILTDEPSHIRESLVGKFRKGLQIVPQRNGA